MKRHWKLIGFLAICAMLLVPLGALADDISPSSITFIANPAAISVFPVHKTVTVSAGTPTTAQADIMFLSDTTGSMGSTIANVQANASKILTETVGIGNVQWAVGEYRDNGDAFVYRLDQAMTASQAAVQTGINAWAAGGGGDTPEANLYAIQQSTLAATGWRAGSARILVQFGDAPGHDPSGPTDVTEAQATAALTSTGTKLIAADVGNKNQTGQETRMTAASGGSYFLIPPGSTPDALSDAVIAAIGESFLTYSTVSLKIVPLVDGLAPISIPAVLSQSGSWDRSVERTFDFDFDLVGCCRAFSEASFDFDIQAWVDDAIVAVEHDHWNCVPLPPSALLLGTGLLGLIPLRRRIKLT